MAIGTLLTIAVFFLSRSKYPLRAASVKQSYLIWIVLLVWPLAHILIALLHQPIAWAQLGNPLRSFIALGVLFFLICVKTNLNALFVGIGVACVAAFSHAMYDRLIRKIPRALGWFNNEIHMGDYSSLVAIFALIIAFLGHQLSNKARAGLFILGCLAYLAAAASGTRTAVFTVVCLLPIFWMQKTDLMHRRLRHVLIIASILSVAVILLSERARKEMRINEGIADVTGMHSGRSQSSIGDRKQMWIAALDMARSSPVLGIGLNNFQKELTLRIESKKILPLFSIQNQAHSQVLHSLATGGIVLLACYLFFVMAPLLWFMGIYRNTHSSDETKLLAYLGSTHIVCHVIFGLTAAIFDIQVFTSLYLLGLAALAAQCLSHQSHQHPTGHSSLAKNA
jgi:O-antigen ligase